MRIGWATPFNFRSAIGKFSQIVCEELRARGHEVEIIRIETGEELALASIDSELPVIEAEACDADRYDALVVNFGNHAPYHAHLMSLLAQRAPIGVFHDIEMRDFEWGLIHRHGLQIPRLPASGSEFGKDSPDLVDPGARSLLAAFASMSCAAVIHGPHYRETISAYCPGPVEVIPLCYPDVGTDRPLPAPAPGRRVAIFGVINDNKQPARVIDALAILRSRLGPVELHLAGAVEERFRSALLDKANELEVEPPIFHGYVSDEALQDILENSHAICCLRYPVTEGGSASLVTALYRARPLVISDIASYSMVPDELAYKVSYGDRSDDLAEALTEIFENGGEAEARAKSARDWARDRFSATSYVDALEPLLHSAGAHIALAGMARKLVPAVTTPDHEPVLAAVSAFAEVLDWMQGCQK